MMGKMAGRIALSGVAMLLAAAPSAALAAEEGGGPGMPQFDAATFASQLFWLVITLVIFFLVLRNVALPRIGGALEHRRGKIDGDLEKAAAHREDAEEAMAAYEKALAEAASEAQSIQRAAARDITAAAAERGATLAAKLADDTRTAETRIAAAMEPALANLPDIAAEVVRDAGERLAGLKVGKSDAEAAVKAALKDMGA